MSSAFSEVLNRNHAADSFGQILQNKEPAQSNSLRGVVYTNLQLYNREPIVTAAGRLLPQVCCETQTSQCMN